MPRITGVPSHNIKKAKQKNRKKLMGGESRKSGKQKKRKKSPHPLVKHGPQTMTRGSTAGKTKKLIVFGWAEKGPMQTQKECGR